MPAHRSPGTTPSRRAKLIRYAKRAIAERAEIDAVLAEGLVAHVGFEQGGQPFVIPMTYLYRDGRLFLHGSKGSRVMKLLASGAPVCINVTLVDSLVASKAASSHSVNYRSAVVFGRGRPVRSRRDLVELSHAIVARYFPDRAPDRDYRAITDEELRSVRFVEVEIEDLSGKRRSGGPLHELDADPSALGWNGIVPLPRRSADDADGRG
jgi:nitroimidazol reductase NimA-like FMN-containing flavoprotein (pyridoxamine 5'-phosphate oxidase superfamily)